MTQPLRGVRVIEFCQVAAGPFCGMLLSDMGADVIKVESPSGDSMRAWPPLRGEDSENFASVNRNKQSVVLDLKTEYGRDAAVQLIHTADVLLENNRPGVMGRLGLGFKELHAVHPALLYCSISAFGQSGPRRIEGGFDLTIQAAAGVMSVTGSPGGEPAKCGVPLSDFSTGLYAAFAIASLLHEVRATGLGRAIDISMLGATLGIAALQTSEFFGTGHSPKALGSAHPRNAPYQAFAARDGHFVMAAGNDRLWRAACHVLGVPHLERDSRFVTTALRASNQAALSEALKPKIVGRSVDDLLAALAAAGVPSAPINTYAQALDDPQVQHMGWVQEITLPSGGRTRTFGSPIVVDGVSVPVRSGPPALGEHTTKVLNELGIKEREERA